MLTRFFKSYNQRHKSCKTLIQWTFCPVWVKLENMSLDLTNTINLINTTGSHSAKNLVFRSQNNSLTHCLFLMRFIILPNFYCLIQSLVYTSCSLITVLLGQDYKYCFTTRCCDTAHMFWGRGGGGVAVPVYNLVAIWRSLSCLFELCLLLYNKETWRVIYLKIFIIHKYACLVCNQF